MKNTLIATMLAGVMAMSSIPSHASTQPDPDIMKFCDVETYNVMVAYSQAKAGVSITDTLDHYPNWKQEVIAGYKLFEMELGQAESYNTFHDYCMSTAKKS